MALVEKHTGRHVIMNGRTYINCTGTAYLNLPYNRSFQQFMQEGMRQFGVDYGSSPQSRPRLSIFEDLELFLAHYYQAEAALLFQSGFSAARACMHLFLEKNHSIKYSSMAHPALRVAHPKTDQQVFAGDLVDPILLRQQSIEQLPNQPSVIDASHGFGLLDETIQKLGQMERVLICGSLNKALGTQAGVVLCSAKYKQALMKSPFYATSSAPSPANCFALLRAFQSGLIAKQQEKLSFLFTQIPKSSNYSFQPPIPVVVLQGPVQSTMERFKQQNILIWHNRYPKEQGELMNRVILHAGLKRQDIVQILPLLA